MNTKDLLYILGKWEIAWKRSPELFTEFHEQHADTGFTSASELAVNVAKISNGVFDMHCGPDTDHGLLVSFMVFMGGAVSGGRARAWEITWDAIPDPELGNILHGIEEYQSRYATELREFIQRKLEKIHIAS